MDVRLTLKTSEGEYIMVSYLGRQAKTLSGGKVNRTGVLFETSSHKHAHLNGTQAVGIGGGYANPVGSYSAKYEIYAITAVPSML